MYTFVLPNGESNYCMVTTLISYKTAKQNKSDQINICLISRKNKAIIAEKDEAPAMK